MKATTFGKVVAVLGLCASLGAAASNAEARLSLGEEAAVKALMAETTEAFNRHDAKAWARFCTPDAQLVSVRGESMKGIAEIEKGLTAVFQTRARNSKLTTLDMAVRFIRPDVALAHVTNEMSGLVSPDGLKLPSHRELSIRVLVKDQGVWRIAAFHNTMLQN